jgi:hypothetical protein
MKGWTESQAKDLVWVRDKQAQASRSVTKTSVAFDTEWNEWTVITRRPGEPTVVERKPRRGLRQSYRIEG